MLACDHKVPARNRSKTGCVVYAAWVMVMMLLLLLPLAALAQSASASYQIPRQSIDGGAGRANSATYTLEGVIGQPDAGTTMTSASYDLRGGFHRAAPPAPLPDAMFADGFEGS